MSFLKDNALSKYLIQSRQELQKVTWPTKRQTKNYTFLVIAASLGLAIFFGVVDYLLTFILELVVRR